MCPTNTDQRLRNMKHEESSNLNKDDPPVKDTKLSQVQRSCVCQSCNPKVQNAAKKRQNPAFFVFCCHFILLLLVCSNKKHENVGDFTVVMKVISNRSARWQAQATFLCSSIGTTSLTETVCIRLVFQPSPSHWPDFIYSTWWSLECMCNHMIIYVITRLL